MPVSPRPEAEFAETGALILWPDAREPRLLSLVPAVHIAILQANTIYNTFGEAMSSERWREGMPTNALLISGPSKTADSGRAGLRPASRRGRRRSQVQ